VGLALSLHLLLGLLHLDLLELKLLLVLCQVDLPLFPLRLVPLFECLVLGFKLLDPLVLQQSHIFAGPLRLFGLLVVFLLQGLVLLLELLRLSLGLLELGFQGSLQVLPLGPLLVALLIGILDLRF